MFLYLLKKIDVCRLLIIIIIQLEKNTLSKKKLLLFHQTTNYIKNIDNFENIYILGILFVGNLRSYMFYLGLNYPRKLRLFCDPQFSPTPNLKVLLIVKSHCL